MRAVCAGAFAGRLELPKPAGPRPRSVAFPCASQERGLLPARCDVVLPITLAEVRFELVIAEGGRFCESSRWRGEVIWDVPGALLGRLFIAGVLPGRLFIEGVLCVGTFCCVAARGFIVLFTGALPVRPELKLALLTVCTRICEAPCAGV